MNTTSKTTIRLLLLAVCALFLTALKAQSLYPNRYPDKVEGKNYYFTALIDNTPELKSFLNNDLTLKSIAQQKQERLLRARAYASRLSALEFSRTEIDVIGQRLAELYDASNALGRLLDEEVIPSGCYSQYEEKGAALVREIWEQDARAMNRTIMIYGEGMAPNYPAIDSIGFDVYSQEYGSEIIVAVAQNVAEQNSDNPSFYSIPMLAVNVLLDVNDRCQLLDFEPLCDFGNKTSYAQIGGTDWDAYPYSAILVLGAGPEEAEERISPQGRLRAAYAALLFRQHKAPFIIVSGGRVHPYHTPYNEAEQMKLYLMEKWQVPEEAIIMEPHARHTTSNMRNTSRIMFREGFPTDKPALVTSSESHLDYVSGTRFARRCEHEMGMVPYRLGNRISDRALEFYPLVEALQINPDEPLDP